jgi:hypothetical protein
MPGAVSWRLASLSDIAGHDELFALDSIIDAGGYDGLFDIDSIIGIDQ